MKTGRWETKDMYVLGGDTLIWVNVFHNIMLFLGGGGVREGCNVMSLINIHLVLKSVYIAGQ